MYWWALGRKVKKKVHSTVCFELFSQPRIQTHSDGRLRIFLSIFTPICRARKWSKWCVKCAPSRSAPEANEFGRFRAGSGGEKVNFPCGPFPQSPTTGDDCSVASQVVCLTDGVGYARRHFRIFILDRGSEYCWVKWKFSADNSCWEVKNGVT